MASGSFFQVHVQCPFYHTDDGHNKLYCEGVIDGSSICQNYKRKADLRQQLEIFCCDYYKNCEIYRMLMEAKYD